MELGDQLRDQSLNEDLCQFIRRLCTVAVVTGQLIYLQWVQLGSEINVWLMYCASASATGKEDDITISSCISRSGSFASLRHSISVPGPATLNNTAIITLDGLKEP